MTHYFLDTSSLVKRYISEDGTAWVRRLHDPLAGHTRWIVWLAAAECIAAMYRRHRMGHIALVDVQSFCLRYRTDVERDYRIIEVTPELTEHAMDLIEQFPLRAYDAVQLASADLMNVQFVRSGYPAITFVCTDTNLNDAALKLGLIVENPRLH